ncbi:hypothetical protein INT45_006260 [Circinella minor]|uniref:DNA replication regulator Sld3 C-terminal domain-containing protein n=1 Tax=Circinella minor TaxID=1195481 RepID=A0A8H7VKT3_9FUNG|nr:hypothetical protein INT45_006260 [Circinella minor]
MINNKRSAPHVIFLVNIVEPNVDTIQHLILNILLYFLDCIDKRTTWGYRFFNGSNNNAATTFISTTTNQSFRSISVNTLETFKQDYLNQQQRQQQCGDNIDSVCSSTFEIIKRTLIQSIAEFHWTNSDLSSESPRRQQQQSLRKQSQIDVKNFIYLVTPMPQTCSSWNDFVASSISTQTLLSSSSKENDIAKSLRLVHTELRRWLWDDYIENRISLSWIDTSSYLSDDDQEAKSIYHGINNVLRPFGGGYTRVSNLTADYNSYGGSFASIFHHLNARTIKVVSEEEALPRSDQELLVAPIQVDMYPINQSKMGLVPNDTKEIDILCAVYRYQINIDSLDTNIPQLYLLVGKNNDDLCTFIQQLKYRNSVAIVKFGNRFGVIEPKAENCILLRLLVSDFKLFDLEPEQSSLDGVIENNTTTTIPAGSNVLDFLNIPATTVKKEKLSVFFKESGQQQQQQQQKSQLKLAPLSSEQASTLEAMKESKVKKEPVTPLPSQEIKEEKDIFQLPSTTETLLSSLQELYYGTLYIQKWTLGDGMKLMYECIDHLLSLSNSILPELITSVKSLSIISSEFDTKHRDLIPSLMDTSSDLSKIPTKEERSYFVEWKNSIIRLRNRDIYELERKARNALKTREGRLQMVIYMLLIWLERRAGKRSKTMKVIKSEEHHPIDLDDPDTENQLNIYYTRVTIWENVYDVAQYLYELESLDIKEHKLDVADVSNSAFCICMNQHLLRIVPDWTKRLLDQCTEGDLMYNAETSLSQTPSITDSQTSTQTSTQRSSQPSSSQQQQQHSQQSQHSQHNKHHHKKQKKRERAPDRIPSSRPKKIRTSDLKDLPFMRREVDLTVRKRPEKNRQAEEATMARIQRSAVNGVPTMKRVGSFIKSAMSPRRSKPEKHEEEEDRVLKVRQPSSPTTPRTRFERDYGFSLSGFGYTPHRHGDDSPHRPRRGSLLSVNNNEESNGVAGDLDLEADVDFDDEGMARTPRRVRQLMMDNTPSGRYSKVRNSPTPHRRPRNNFAEALLDTISASAPASLGNGDDNLDDLCLSGSDDDDDDVLDLTKLSSFNTNPLRLDSDEEDEEDEDNPYLYK